MSILQRPGTQYWWYSVSRGRGKPRLRGSTGKTDRAEAEAVEHVVRLAFAGKTSADKLHALIDALSGKVHEGLSLAGVWQAYEGWLKSTGKRMADITLRQRKRACERLADWAKENWPAVACAGEVDRACAAGFATFLSEKKTSGKTRRNLIGDLGTVWEGLRRVRDDVKENPWPLVLPENDSERLEAFTRAEEKKVLEAADKRGYGWGLACRIARYTGLRYGDVARLRWADVDLDAGVIRIKPSKTARHGVDVVMPVCDELAKALRGVKQDGEFVLPEHAEYYPNPWQGPQGKFSEVLATAGFKDDRYTFHSWRHTFRTRLAEAGVTDEIAKRLGGWTEDATARRYDHDGRLKELREAVEKGAGPVGGKKKPGGKKTD